MLAVVHQAQGKQDVMDSTLELLNSVLNLSKAGICQGSEHVGFVFFSFLYHHRQQSKSFVWVLLGNSHSSFSLECGKLFYYEIVHLSVAAGAFVMGLD